jgi:DNA polymerase-3 subunit gamma/tau
LIQPLPDVPATATIPNPAVTAPATANERPAAAVREKTAVPPDTVTLNRPPKSTSLHTLVDKKPEEIHPSPSPVTKENKPFSAEDLIRCWDAYAENIEKEVHLKNTMLSCKPLLLENAHFEVAVHNPLQKDKLVGHSLELLKMMREQLSNSKIQMHVRIEETNEKKLAYTSLEKYELLHQINPLLSKLKAEFDLSID